METELTSFEGNVHVADEILQENTTAEQVYYFSRKVRLLIDRSEPN
jgi:hypothetical protein